MATTKSELTKALIERGKIVASLIVDCVYIALWVLAAWLLDTYIIIPLKVSGVDKVTLSIFQWVSGLTTLGILLGYAIRDFIIVVIRICLEIREEIENATNKNR
jgi:hypothetical protein